MKYYTARRSSDPSIVGIKNGASQAQIYRDGFGDKGMYDRYIDYFFTDDQDLFWERIGQFPDFEIDIEHLKLEKGARLTDFLSYYPEIRGGGNFIISERAVEILKKFNLPNYKLYSVTIFSNDTSEIIKNYKLLHCLPLPYDVIDFSKTTFFKGNRIRGKSLFNLSSYHVFEERKNEDVFQIENLFLNENFDRKLDYFISRVSIPDVFISERLRDAIRIEGLTGLEITEPYEPSLIF